MNTDKRCARCDDGTMKRWSELTDDEQEVVMRLPDSAIHTAAERKAMHQWCTRCWYEETGKPEQS